MTTSLLGSTAAILTRGGEGCLCSVAQLVCETTQVERVSVTFFEHDQFTVVASSGWDLLGRGARLPLDASTHFSSAATGQLYQVDDFRRESEFHRPVDQLVLGNGFRSGCSIPMKVGEPAMGALSLSSARAGSDVAYRFEELSGVAALIAMHRLNPPGQSAPSVLVCGDRLLVAHGIARLLETCVGLSAVVATTFSDAVRLASDSDVALVLSDTYFAARPVSRLMDAIRPVRPSARLVVVSDHDIPANRVAAAAAGAVAFLSGTSIGRPEVVRPLVAGAVGPVSTSERRGRESAALTPREGDVLLALDRGLSVRQVARELGLAQTTVKSYARSLFEKLDVHSRSEAVYRARVQGILDSLLSSRAL